MPPLGPTKNNDPPKIEEFIRDLEATADLVQKVLSDLRENEIDFVAIKTELRILCENVKEISSIIRDGDGGVSLVTKVALLEQRIKELEKDSTSKETDYRAQQISLAEIEVADKKGKWEMRTAVAVGIIGLLTTIATILVKVFG